MNPRPFVCPACASTKQGYALRCAECFPERRFFAKGGAIAKALRRAVNRAYTNAPVHR